MYSFIFHFIIWGKMLFTLVHDKLYYLLYETIKLQ